MKYSEVSTDGRYTLNHNSNLLHEFLTGDRFYNNTSMFRTSLILAMLKIKYLIHESIFDDAMNEISPNEFRVNNKFDDLNDLEFLDKVKRDWGMVYINDLNNPQVIKDGIDSMYNDYLLKSGVDVICDGIGTMAIKGDTIILISENERRNPYSAILEIGSWIDDQIRTIVPIIIKDIYIETNDLSLVC